METTTRGKKYKNCAKVEQDTFKSSPVHFPHQLTLQIYPPVSKASTPNVMSAKHLVTVCNVIRFERAPIYCPRCCERDMYLMQLTKNW